MEISYRIWGKNSKSEDICIYTLENDYLKVEILNLGAIIKKIEIKNINKNVVVSYDKIEDYENNPAYIGATIGRNAGRIEKGILKLADKSYQLSINNGENNLHGGENSISHKLWNIEIKKDRLSCFINSPHLENGFPANVKIQVDYILKNNELILEYYAESDNLTYINMTNHSYFNLGENLIYEDILEIDADYIIKINENSIPYEALKIEKSIFDFKKPKKIKEFFEDFENFKDNEKQKTLANNGIDHSYILNKNSEKPIKIFNKNTGIKMEIETNNPAVVIYTANYFENIGLQNHSGICFETQDAPNLFKDVKLSVSPTFTDVDKPYKRYTKFIFSNI